MKRKIIDRWGPTITRTVTRGPMTCRLGRWVKYDGQWHYIPAERGRGV